MLSDLITYIGVVILSDYNYFNFVACYINQRFIG